ncbi:MAG: hypothetical protein GKR94_26325 [Gammaproteobacteria bacterium]|nr:hypothetical protein [Gammaproteobacteria bacterium]
MIPRRRWLPLRSGERAGRTPRLQDGASQWSDQPAANQGVDRLKALIAPGESLVQVLESATSDANWVQRCQWLVGDVERQRELVRTFAAHGCRGSR